MEKERIKKLRNKYKKRDRKRKRRIILFIIIISFAFGAFKIINGELLGLKKKEFNNYLNSNSVESEYEIVSKKNDYDSWKLLLVNPWNSIPKDHKIELKEISNGKLIDKRIFKDFNNMMEDAKAEGLSPIVCSAYRSIKKQKQLFNNQVNKYINRGYSQNEAEYEAKKWVAEPGKSEHNTGLALDIVSLDYQHLDEKQEDTAEQKWLMNNSYKYGFILRYPKDKVDITGISYEPWHYRYVGKSAARNIYGKRISLEEYLDSEDENSIKNRYSFESLLVNREKILPEDYFVNLVEVDDRLGGKVKVASVIKNNLNEFIDYAYDNNIEICLNSAYRSSYKQKEIFDNKIESIMNEGISYENAKEMTLDRVALPKHSEHETGLAVDFGLLGETTWEEGYSWIEENAYKYGFILRYPKNKEDITKIHNEPWHYRFVGKDVAKIIKNKGISLEEYLQK